jgi:hypothetical protein
MPAGQYDCVFGVCIADHAFGLEITFHRHRGVVNAEDVVQVENRLVIKEILLYDLELVRKLSGIFRGLKCAVCELDLLLGPSFVAVREDSLDTNHYWEVVVLLGRQLVLLVLAQVKLADAFLKLLFKARTEHVGLRQRILILVSVEAIQIDYTSKHLQKRIGRCISAFRGAEVDRNDAFVIRREHEFDVVLLICGGAGR